MYNEEKNCESFSKEHIEFINTNLLNSFILLTKQHRDWVFKRCVNNFKNTSFSLFSSLQPNIPRDSLIKPTDIIHDTLDKKQIDIENPAKSVENTLLDLDIQESVSKLESDITKTIENNNNKLKELEHLLHEEKKSKQLITKVIEDDVVPIVETISDDEIVEIVKKPESVDKVEEDYVVEDVTLLKKLIAEGDNKEDSVVETIENVAVQTEATPIDVVTTEKQFIETSTENTIQTTVALVTTLATTIKVRLFAPEVNLYLGL